MNMEDNEDAESTKSEVKLGKLQFSLDYDFQKGEVTTPLTARGATGDTPLTARVATGDTPLTARGATGDTPLTARGSAGGHEKYPPGQYPLTVRGARRGG